MAQLKHPKPMTHKGDRHQGFPHVSNKPADHSWKPMTILRFKRISLFIHFKLDYLIFIPKSFLKPITRSTDFLFWLVDLGD